MGAVLLTSNNMLGFQKIFDLKISRKEGARVVMIYFMRFLVKLTFLQIIKTQNQSRILFK